MFVVVGKGATGYEHKIADSQLINFFVELIKSERNITSIDLVDDNSIVFI